MHKRDWTWRGQPKVQGSSGHSFKLLVAVEKAAKGRGQSRISLIKCSSRIRVALLPSATNFRLLTHPYQPEYEPRHTHSMSRWGRDATLWPHVAPSPPPLQQIQGTITPQSMQRDGGPWILIRRIPKTRSPIAARPMVSTALDAMTEQASSRALPSSACSIQARSRHARYHQDQKTFAHFVSRCMPILAVARATWHSMDMIRLHRPKHVKRPRGK